MASLLNKIKRIIKPPLSGFDHPALRDSFNALAQSPFGPPSVEFCKKRNYEIIITDDLPQGTLGTCSYSKIRLRPEASYTTMAHEMRHAFQMHSLKTHASGSSNPLYKHMEVRMTEADAFTFSCLVQLSRWKELGYRGMEPHLERKNDADRITINAFAAYSKKDFDPKILLQILRHVFNYHYERIAAGVAVEGSYEYHGMESAEAVYQKLADDLTPSKTMLKAIMLALFVPDQKTYLENKLIEYNNPLPLVDTLAEKLGQVPGLEGNYLTDTQGPKLSSPYYMKQALPPVLQFHADWHQKIRAKIDGHPLLAKPDRRPAP